MIRVIENGRWLSMSDRAQNFEECEWLDDKVACTSAQALETLNAPDVPQGSVPSSDPKKHVQRFEDNCNSLDWVQ